MVKDTYYLGLQLCGNMIDDVHVHVNCTLHIFIQDELAEVLVVLFDYKNKLVPFLYQIINTEVCTYKHIISLLGTYS